MKIVVTGATGYIGRRFLARAKECGHVMVAGSRSPVPGVSAWLKFDLAQSDDIQLPHDAGAIVHLAADMSGSVTEDDEVGAAQSLIRTAKKAGAKIVFVSSQAARQDGPTKYGRTKWRIEREVLEAGGVVVRPGQVYGGEECGLFGMLTRIVSRFPVLPAFVPGPSVQPIHIDDLVDGLIRIVERGDLDGKTLHLASQEPVTFTRFLSELAKHRVRRARLFIPVPTKLIEVVGTFLPHETRERTGLDRLQSLFELPVMNTSEDLRLLGMGLRTLHAGMCRSGDDRRRCLLREGRVLVHYLLRSPPQRYALRRYVRAIERLKGGEEARLRGWILFNPWAVALLDEGAIQKAANSDLRWRLHVASVLAEASVPGAARFLGPMEGRSILSVVTGIMRVVMAELLWRMLRALVPLRGLYRGN